MRRLLDPLLIGALALTGQAGLWYFGMPETPSIPGAAPRFVDAGSFMTFSIFAAVFLWAIFFGKVLARGVMVGQDRTHARRRRRLRHAMSMAPDPDRQQRVLTALTQERFAYLQRVAKAAAFFALLGELLYVRQLLSNPSIIINAFTSGSFTNIGEHAAGDRLVGLSSLNNLFVVPVASFALMYFSQEATPEQRARARRWLTGIGATVLLHAFLFVGRQAFVSMLLIIAGAFLYSGVKKSRTFWKMAAVLAVLLAFLVWMGETLRAGSYYAHDRNTGLFSAETQDYVLHRLVEGYFAADFNNALVLLSCESPRDWIGSTMWASPAAQFGYTSTDYATCSRWVSQFGTLNVVGSWWWDAEWWGLLFALACGLWLGASSAAALRSSGPPGFAAVVYLLTFPGVISLTRINYFGETIFVAPVLFMWAAWVLRPQPNAGRRRRRTPRRRHQHPAGLPARLGIATRVVPFRGAGEGR